MWGNQCTGGHKELEGRDAPRERTGEVWFKGVRGKRESESKRVRVLFPAEHGVLGLRCCCFAETHVSLCVATITPRIIPTFTTNAYATLLLLLLLRRRRRLLLLLLLLKLACLCVWHMSPLHLHRHGTERQRLRARHTHTHTQTDRQTDTHTGK
jgi:hypothetical protein